MVSIDELVKKMEIDQRRRERWENSMPFSFSTAHASTNSTTTPNSSFLGFELLMDAILHMSQTSDMTEFIQVCRTPYAEDVPGQQRIDEFERTYTPETSIRWYSRNSFVYRVLNTALRLQNVEVLVACRFLIRDINEQLRNVQQDQNRNITEVYRGQNLSIEDLKRMKQNNGEIISFHSFLSATRDRMQAIGFVPTPPGDENFINVLFEIECDQHYSTSPSSKPFADIQSVSVIPTEEEVLFALGTHFRLTGTDYDEKHDLQIIKLTHISAVRNARNYIEDIQLILGREPALELLPHQPLEGDTYEAYYRSLLGDASENESEAMLYTIAGNTAREQKNFDLALKYLRKALDIQSSHPSSDEIYRQQTRNYIRIVQERKAKYMREEQSLGEPLQKMVATEGSRNRQETNENDSSSDDYHHLVQRQLRYHPFNCVYSAANQEYGEMVGINFYRDDLDREILDCQRVLAISAKSPNKKDYLHHSLENKLAYLIEIKRRMSVHRP